MSYTTTVKNTAIDAMTALGNRVSLHTGDPGSSGANESGVTRQTTTWGSASGGVSDGTQVTFAAVPAGTYTHYGIWTSDDATFRWGFALDPGTTLLGTGPIHVTPHLTFP